MPNVVVMLSRSLAQREGIRKWALRFYREEQLSHNSSLHGLSAVQKKKVIMKMFKGLSKPDMEILKFRATTYQRMVMAGEPNALQAMKNHKAAPFTKEEITPYEFFVKEQCSNPAIVSLPNSLDRERKLLEIYNSLPQKARDALEQRATDFNTAQRYGVHAASRLQPVVRRDAAARSVKKVTKSAKRAAAKPTAAKGATQTKKAKRTASPYAKFVQEQMPTLSAMPFKERMKEVAKRWRALSDEERATRLAIGVAAQRKAALAMKSEEDPAPSPANRTSTTVVEATTSEPPASSAATRQQNDPILTEVADEVSPLADTPRDKLQESTPALSGDAPIETSAGQNEEDTTAPVVARSPVTAAPESAAPTGADTGEPPAKIERRRILKKKIVRRKKTTGAADSTAAANASTTVASGG